MKLVSVKVKNGDINKALKAFKRGCMESGHLQEHRERQEYLKPSVIKRKMMQHAIYVAKQQHKEENQSFGA